MDNASTSVLLVEALPHAAVTLADMTLIIVNGISFDLNNVHHPLPTDFALTAQANMNKPWVKAELYTKDKKN